MLLDARDKDRLLAACQAAVLRVSKDRGLPLCFPAVITLTHDTEDALGIELKFAKEAKVSEVQE